MKRIIHYGIVLFLIAIVISGTLAKINQNTSVIIEQASREKIKNSRKMVLQEASEFKMDEIIKKESYEFIPGYNNGEKVGYVTNVSSSGYGGDIIFVLGFDLSGEIKGINIIESKETPGLGAKIMNRSWQKKWEGRTSDYEFNKSVDAFAGATVSPKAVYTGIQEALKVYEEEVKSNE
ncbi:MAG: RnfABCDGE type electron transport complex subunit G [Fusobacteriota bacterium]